MPVCIAPPIIYSLLQVHKSRAMQAENDSRSRALARAATGAETGALQEGGKEYLGRAGHHRADQPVPDGAAATAHARCHRRHAARARALAYPEYRM